MSVLKNKRSLSRYEYEHSFEVAYKHVRQAVLSTSNRRKKWICKPINLKLNEIYSTIMEIRTNYVPKDKKGKTNYHLITQSIRQICELQIPFYTYWNIMDLDTRKMKHWCELFNNDIALFYGMLIKNPLYNKDDKRKQLMYYKKEDIKKAKFLHNMSELHKYVHGKITHVKQTYEDQECAMLADFTDRAWYYCIEANRKIPTTKTELDHRLKSISNAISCLKKSEIPTKSLFLLMDYSESTIREWSILFDETLKCLFALRKSDIERFSDLK